MSHGDQCVEVKSRKRRLITVEEIARQYYLLAKATMSDRNVSSIYMVCLGDLPDDESSDRTRRFRQKMNSLSEDGGLEAVILDSRDLSVKHKNELAKLIDGSGQGTASRTSKRQRGNMEKLYFQLQRPRVP